MKSEDYRGISERNVLPSVRKLGLRQKVSGPFSRTTTPWAHIQPHKRMVAKRKMECFKMTSNESWPKRHSKSLGENWNLPSAKKKRGKKYSIKVKRAWTASRREGEKRCKNYKKHSELQLLPNKGWQLYLRFAIFHQVSLPIVQVPFYSNILMKQNWFICINFQKIFWNMYLKFMECQKLTVCSSALCQYNTLTSHLG